MAKQRYLRPGERLDDDDIVVVRGGDLDPEALRADTARYHSIYGGYGLGVRRPRRTRRRARTAGTARQVRGADPGARRLLRSAGFRLEPTGRNPRHFTIAFDDLEAGIAELRRCEGRSWVNPYHEDWTEAW